MPPEAQIYTLANGSWLIVGKDICQEISAHYAEGATVRQRVEHLRRLADNLERIAKEWPTP